MIKEKLYFVMKEYNETDRELIGGPFVSTVAANAFIYSWEQQHLSSADLYIVSTFVELERN